MKSCLCFLNPPFFGVSYLLFFLSLRRPHSLFVPCFTDSWCLISLLLVFSFPTFFFSFSLFLFSLSMLPLLLFASRYVFLLSLSCASSVDSFFLKIHFYLFSFKKIPSFSFVHPFFVRLFLFHLFCCFAPFFFNRVLSNKINWLFSSSRKKHLFNTSKNIFSEFLLFFLKKSLSSFFDFFRSSLFQKNKLFFWISKKIPHKNGFNNKMIVQISLSGNLFVFRKKSVSPAF